MVAIMDFVLIGKTTLPRRENSVKIYFRSLIRDFYLPIPGFNITNRISYRTKRKPPDQRRMDKKYSISKFYINSRDFKVLS